MSFQGSFDFGSDPNDKSKVALDSVRSELATLAKQGIYFGTSSWKFRGWEGIVYGRSYSSEAEFQRECLREYSQLFPAVGVDSTFYTWPVADQAQVWKRETPEDFRFCFKATDRLTIRRFPNIPRYGHLAGLENSQFLDPAAFKDLFWEPLRALGPKVGSLIFEFGHLDIGDLPRLEHFLRKIPREAPLSVEVRNAELVKSDFYSILRHLDVAPVLNSWTRMPPLRVQWKVFHAAGDGPSGVPLVVRGLIRPFKNYEEALLGFSPFRARVEEFPEFHEDMRELVHWCIKERRPLYVLIGNNLEGSAPLTIEALVKHLRLH